MFRLPYILIPEYLLIIYLVHCVLWHLLKSLSRIISFIKAGIWPMLFKTIFQMTSTDGNKLKAALWHLLQSQRHTLGLISLPCEKENGMVDVVLFIIYTVPCRKKDEM